MKEAFVVLDEELNTNWESMKDKMLDVQSNLVVSINSESVKRLETAKQLGQEVSDLKDYVDHQINQIQNSSVHDLEVVKNASKDNQEKIKDIQENIDNIVKGFDNLQTDFTEKNLSMTMNVRNITSQQVMQDQLCRVDSKRTYEDLKNASELIKQNVDMLAETRDTQNSFNMSAANSIKSLESTMGGSMLQKVDEKCERIFEKVKKEQNAIWQNCLGFTANIDDEKLDFLKEDPSIKNNYAYAVGGQDVFELPNLNAIDGDENDNQEEVGEEEIEQEDENLDDEEEEVDEEIDEDDDQDGDDIDEEIDDSNPNDIGNSDDYVDNSNETGN